VGGESKGQGKTIFNCGEENANKGGKLTLTVTRKYLPGNLSGLKNASGKRKGARCREPGEARGIHGRESTWKNVGAVKRGKKKRQELSSEDRHCAIKFRWGVSAFEPLGREPPPKGRI